MAHYKPTGVCATSLDFDLANDGTVHNVCFTRGCDGNAKGIAKLVEGRPAQEVVTCLEGITCGTK
ncbi:MAG: TIGR03905 family TSCPD domain-containing protein, partial [Coriobacteriales bacterium]|nr:TIGR03905 family TSCPD domain-containing protein [Coriobacteriales bacterium]